MHLKVTLSNIDAAITALEQYEKDLERKANEIAKRVAEVGADEVKAADSMSVATALEPIEQGYRLDATHPAIVFMEFGTGVRTESGAPYADKVSVPVYPGSWSDEHAGTWRKWIESGKDPEEYPFNRYPKRGMYRAMRKMVNETKDIAKRVFNE